MKKTLRKDINEEIILPIGIEARAEGNKIFVKKDNKELSKIIDNGIKIEIGDNKIILSVKKAKKNDRRKFGTAKSHIKNMLEGIEKEYEYELEVCNVHFPMTVAFDKAKKEFLIKNLLGERSPRVVKVSNTENLNIEIKMPHIKIKSCDLELAGQTAANLEKISRVKNRDRNKFQDGIFITKKPGKVYS